VARIEEARGPALRWRVPGEPRLGRGHQVPALLERLPYGRELFRGTGAIERGARFRVLLERSEVVALRGLAGIDLVLEALHVVGERHQIVAGCGLHLPEARGLRPAAPERTEDEERNTNDDRDRPEAP
jgi:hypothetical protein